MWLNVVELLELVLRGVMVRYQEKEWTGIEQ